MNINVQTEKNWLSVNKNFIDEREPNKTISIQQLKAEYLQRDKDELVDVTFGQWLNNCLQSNNGTLAEVK